MIKGEEVKKTEKKDTTTKRGKETKTKSLVLTSPPPAAHPSCIHLDDYTKS